MAKLRIQEGEICRFGPDQGRMEQTSRDETRTRDQFVNPVNCVQRVSGKGLK